MNDKPKQYWADKSLFEAKGYVQQRMWVSDFERPNTIRVVEYSAYEQLCQQLAAISKERDEWREGSRR